VAQSVRTQALLIGGRRMHDNDRVSVGDRVGDSSARSEETDGCGRIAVYTDIYLERSMTFVYHEIMGLRQYTPVVMAATAKNLDMFAGYPVFVPSPVMARRTFVDRGHRRLLRAPAAGQLAYYIRIVRENDVKLIHAHFGPGGLRMVHVKRRCGIPLIVNFHGYDAGQFPRRLRNRLRVRWLFRAADHFLTPSQHMKRRLIELGCPGHKVTVHYIGVPVEAIRYADRRSPPRGTLVRLLQVSNLVEKKGTLYLLEAFSIVCRRHSDVQLRLVGDGPMRPLIEERIRRLGLSESVTLAGPRPHYDIPDELAAAHIFVHPSVTGSDGDMEATPIAIKEAMASGLPVVSTYHGGIPELVENGRSGFLAPERDAESLATHLEHLLQHPEVWAHLGRRGRSIVEKRHSLVKQVNELEVLYSQVMSGQL